MKQRGLVRVPALVKDRDWLGSKTPHLSGPIKLGPDEDVCASRRRDFFVNYVFNLPKTLPPGSYRLRLTQTDLVANQSTIGGNSSRDHPVK